MAERALLAGLDGSCRTPISAMADITADGRLHLRGAVLSLDECVFAQIAMPASKRHPDLDRRWQKNYYLHAADVDFWPEQRQIKKLPKKGYLE